MLQANHRCSGAALPMVVFFAATAFIIVSVYIQQQRALTFPIFREPEVFQALLNARSGIWKSIDMLSGSPPESLKTINTRDPRFGGDLLNDTLLNPSEALVAGQGPISLNIFTSDSFGTCEAELEFSGVFQVLKSNGYFRDHHRQAVVRLGGKAFAGPDTVLYIQANTRPRGGRIQGEIKLLGVADTIPRKRGQRGAIPPMLSEKQLRDLLSDYDRILGQASDSTTAGTRMLVKDNRELEAIPDVVSGDLFLHSTFEGLSWNSRRTIVVLGDLQCTGTSPLLMTGMRLIVHGSAQFFDKTVLRDVSVFCRRKLVLGGEARFSGDAVSLSDALIYERASVRDRGIITVVRREARNRPSPPDSTRSTYQIDIADRGRVDGTLVTIGAPQGIRTGPQTAIRGVLWSGGSVCHQGTLEGVLWARTVVDCRAVTVSVAPNVVKGGETENTLVGNIVKLSTLGEYHLPFFIGEPRIISWVEK